MGRHRIITSPAELRPVAASGMEAPEDSARPTNRQTWSSSPEEAAVEFAAFCTRNPKPCPLLEITPPGDPEPARSALGSDLRVDLPGYRIYRHGELVERRGEIRNLWRDDLASPDYA